MKKKYKSWTLLSDEPTKRGNLKYFLCMCSCGRVKEVCYNHLVSKKSCFSCRGCANVKKGLHKKDNKDFEHNRRLLSIYILNRNRNIIDKTWDTFEKFQKSIIDEYKEKLKKYGKVYVSRKDTTKKFGENNYEILSVADFGKNNKRTIIVNYNNKDMSLKEVSKELNINRATLYTRYKKTCNINKPSGKVCVEKSKNYIKQKETLEKLIKNTSGIDRKIFKYRLSGMSWEDIAKKFNVTKQRINQIYVKKRKEV